MYGEPFSHLILIYLCQKSRIELLISINEFLVSINELLLSINEFLIARIRFNQ